MIFFCHKGSAGLCVAIGKQMGSIGVWSVTGLDFSSAELMIKGLKNGTLKTVKRAHDSLPVTALHWTRKPCQDKRQVVGYLGSTGLNKELKSWQVEGQKVRTLELLQEGG